MSLDDAKPALGITAGLALVAASLWVLWLGGRILLRGLESQNWPATEAVVVKSEIEVKQRKEHTSTGTGSSKSTSIVVRDNFYTLFAYSYRVNGTPYTSDRVSFSHAGIELSEHAAKRFLDQYPLGAKLTAYINPDDPHDAVLKPGMNFDGMGFLIGMAAFIALPGVVIIVFSVRSILKIRRNISSGSRGASRIRFGS